MDPSLTNCRRSVRNNTTILHPSCSTGAIRPMTPSRALSWRQNLTRPLTNVKDPTVVIQVGTAKCTSRWTLTHSNRSVSSPARHRRACRMALGCVQDLAPSVPQSLADKITAAVGTVRSGTAQGAARRGCVRLRRQQVHVYTVPVASLRHPHEHITATLKAPPTQGSRLHSISAAQVFSQ